MDMLPLDDGRWAFLTDAYGPATDIPRLLRDAKAVPADLPEGPGGDVEPYFSLWSALCHQGDVYTASYAAVPHLMRIVGDNVDCLRWNLLSLVQAIESSRVKGRGPLMPEELGEAYVAALSRVPTIAAALLRAKRDELEMQVILSACAAARGFTDMSDAILELTPEIIRKIVEHEI